MISIRKWLAHRNSRSIAKVFPPSAMEIRKRKEFTVETDEVVVVKRVRIYHAWCNECQRDVDMVQLADAYTVAGISERQHEPQGAAAWHISHDNELPLVCLDSVLNSA